MITQFKLFEQHEDVEKKMLNDIISRFSTTRFCQRNYMKYISETNLDYFTVDDVFDEYESKKKFLEDEYDIQVVKIKDEYLVSFNKYTEEIGNLIGNQPVLLYHYTSSKLLPSILEKGLLIGYKKTNPGGNSYAGVYLTTEYSGFAVKIYGNIAVRKHGGREIRLYIKKYLNELTQDPDDADIRTGDYQFITDKVLPDEIITYENSNIS
jgi:hypothetical protein